MESSEILNKQEQVYKYIRRIRNPQKRQYAECYFRSLAFPTMPTPNSDNWKLSYMAAQGVRLQIGYILSHS